MEGLKINHKEHKEGDSVYIAHHCVDKWIPKLVKIAYISDSYMYDLYIETNKGLSQETHNIGKNFNEVFNSYDECNTYIQKYFYPKGCEVCKYDKYSTIPRCNNCLNKDENDVCTKIKSILNIEIKNPTNICQHYNPKINNGDWVNWDWFMEVLKNCWCNTECSILKGTAYSTNTLENEMNKVISFCFNGNYKNRLIKGIGVPYYEWINQAFIKDDKIHIRYVNYKLSNNKGRHLKSDYPLYEYVDKWVELCDLLGGVKNV